MAQLAVFLAAGVVMLAPVVSFASESIQLTSRTGSHCIARAAAAPGPRPHHHYAARRTRKVLLRKEARAGSPDPVRATVSRWPFPRGAVCAGISFRPGQVPVQEVAFFQPHGGLPDDVSFINCWSPSW